MFDPDEWKQERFIRNTLRKLARQRVTMIMQPGDCWVIKTDVGDSDKVEEALKTCHLRGWVEILTNAMPTGSLTAEGKLPTGALFTQRKPLYRLTDAGWNAIYRIHDSVIATFFITFASLVVSVVALIISITALNK